MSLINEKLFTFNKNICRNFWIRIGLMVVNSWDTCVKFPDNHNNHNNNDINFAIILNYTTVAVISHSKTVLLFSITHTFGSQSE